MRLKEPLSNNFLIRFINRMQNRKLFIVAVTLIVQLLLNDFLSFSLYFVPALFLIIPITLNFDTKPWNVLLITFLSALLFDILSDGVLGLYAAAATFAAAVRILILPLFISNEMWGKINYPAPQSIGPYRFILFSILMFSAFMVVYIFFDGFGIVSSSLIIIRFLLSVGINSAAVFLILYFFEKKR